MRDEGEDGGHVKRSPILVPDGQLDKRHVLEEFEKRSRELAPEITALIKSKLAG